MRFSLKTLLPMVVLFFLLLTMAGAYGVAEEGRRQQAFRDVSLVAQKDAYHLLQEPMPAWRKPWWPIAVG